MIAYADDFIVTAASEQYLKNKVVPTLTASLREVGLELSAEKSRITKIEDGFDLLGFNIRKYQCEKLLIKPSQVSRHFSRYPTGHPSPPRDEKLAT